MPLLLSPLSGRRKEQPVRKISVPLGSLFGRFQVPNSLFRLFCLFENNGALLNYSKTLGHMDFGTVFFWNAPYMGYVIPTLLHDRF